MKKLLAVFALAIAAAPIFADIYFPHRFVEFGVNADLEAGQNIFGVSDIFVKDLVIDLPKIYEDMGDGGFFLNAGEAVSMFANVNIMGYGIGFKASETLNARLNISREFFKLLAEGNELDTEVETSTSLSLESYIDVSVPIYLKFNGLKITATPSFFVPILYLPNPKATLTYCTQSDGKVYAKGLADFTLYSLIDLSGGIVTDENTGNTSFDFSGLGTPEEMLKSLMASTNGCGGVDLALQVEYPFMENLDIGAYTNVPIVHGLLKNSVSGSVDFSVDMDGFLDYYTSGEETEGNAFDVEYSVGNLVTNSSQYYVNRPFRIGLEAAYRPFGNWFTIHPKVGVAMRNPFGSDFSVDSIYPEYSLSAQFSLLNILGANLTTQYVNQVFAHSLGLYLNARVLEINLNIGTGGCDFLKSFTISGLKASVGVTVGI